MEKQFRNKYSETNTEIKSIQIYKLNKGYMIYQFFRIPKKVKNIFIPYTMKIVDSLPQIDKLSIELK